MENGKLLESGGKMAGWVKGGPKKSITSDVTKVAPSGTGLGSAGGNSGGWLSDVGSAIGRNLARIPEKIVSYGLGGIGSLQEQIAPVGQKNNVFKPLVRLPTVEQVEGVIEPWLEKALGKQKGYFQPKNKFEEGVDMVARDLPLMAISGGGSAAAKLMGSIISSGAAKSVESLGAGPMWQMLAGIAGSRAANRVTGKMSPARVIKLAEKEKEFEYATRDKVLASKGNPKFKSEALAKDSDELVEMFDNMFPSTKSKIRHDLGYISTKIKDGEMSVKDAIDLKKWAYKEAYSHNYGTPANEFYRKTGLMLKNFIEEAAYKDPSWGLSHLRADDLNKGIEASRKIGDIAEIGKGAGKLKTVGNITWALLNRKPSGVMSAAKSYMKSTDNAKEIAMELKNNSKIINNMLENLKEQAMYGNKEQVANMINQINITAQKEQMKLRPRGHWVKGGPSQA
jgi:hypothetical protein